MLAAVTSRPCIATPGRPTPTGADSEMPDDLASRRTSRAIDALTLSGVDGCGVRTRSRSERNRPVSVSTTAALMPLPPTSTPMAIRPLAMSLRTSSGSGVRHASDLRSS